MNNYENIEFDDLINNEQPIFEGKKNTQVYKRKWREIEFLKEKRRLRRELADYNLCSI
ncbi:MAG: DUF3545 family protein [Colwellia sp.]|nr:DUF3545 family protein [Colwellia sp.]